MDKEKYIKLFKEFIRYVIVGGISFLADTGTLTLFEEFIFTQKEGAGLFISTAAGFIVGLIVNYILSLIFVFKSSENERSGKDVKSFIVFTIVGIIGLGLTEIGMYVGVTLLSLHYIFTKIIVAAIVLVWNYAGRKILIFK